MTGIFHIQTEPSSNDFNGSSSNTAWMSLRGSRPPALQDLIYAAGNVLLAHDVETTAKFIAGKVFHNLSRPSGFYRAGGPPVPHPNYFDLALETAGAIDGPVFALAAAIAEIYPELRWYRSAIGPFASINFVRDHAHALLVGPGGLEERDDVHVGLTAMSPFSRFPDHRRSYPSVFLTLSPAEIRVGDADWVARSPGGIFFSDEGCEIAMRCTRSPLLLLWCHRIRGR